MTDMARGAPILSVRHISKQFPGVKALDDISLEFRPGEIHALAGENGAGKSTFIKVLGGIITPDQGQMGLAGQPYAPSGPNDAIARGVRVVHQEFNLLRHLSVAENLLFERLPRKLGILVDKAEMRRRARELLNLVGLSQLDPSTPISSLGIAQQQLVEIARALSDDARVLILDEPTATLTPRETHRLFEIVHRLKDQGTSVLFISHHLDEIFAHCDRVTVFRNGKLVATQQTAEIDTDGLVRQMVGREVIHAPIARAVDRSATPALSISGFQTAINARRPDIAFDLYPGEILGIAGLVGSGRSEVLRAIFGADRPARGRISRNGQPVTIQSPRDALRQGICLVTENRKEEGLILPMSIAVNTTLATVRNISSGGLLDRGKERGIAGQMMRSLDTRMASLQQAVGSLSGGNQQKVVLGKWLLRDPQILMLDEPTRGIDIGAKAEIYALLRQLADQGVGILVVSSEVPELLGLADRVLVMSRGVIAGELAHQDMSEEAILQLAYAEYAKEQVIRG